MNQQHGKDETALRLAEVYRRTINPCLKGAETQKLHTATIYVGYPPPQGTPSVYTGPTPHL